MMIKNKRTIIISVVCFSIAVYSSPKPSRLPMHPPLKPGMTAEEWHKALEKWHDYRYQQERNNLQIMMREAWKRLLHVTEQQWRFIEPKHGELEALYHEMFMCAVGRGGRNEQSFRWHRRSKAKGGRGIKAKNPEDLTEGEKLVEELIDLLEDEKSTDEQIRKKIDALQQAREKPRKALPLAKKELAKVLTTPRQEAILLIMGYID